MKNIIGLLGVAILISGCGSAVQLESAPVVDKAGVDVSQQGNASNANANANAVSKASTNGNNLGAKEKMVASPRNVYFDFDRFVIKPEFQSLIASHSNFLKENKSARIAIEGHTDEAGSREYNLALGQKRAEAVRSAMSLLGVSDSQVEAVSFGKEKPIAQGKDSASMSKNRRAEIVYR